MRARAALVVCALAACGPRPGRGVPRSTAVARVPPEWSCLRVDHPGEGVGSRAVLALLEDGYVKFAPPAGAPAGSVCIGLFERASVARATATGLGEDVNASALQVQALTGGEVAALPAEARAVAYVSAPISLVGAESSGPVAIERTGDGKTLLLFAQDLIRGDLGEGRLYVLNQRVGRVEIFAAWDFLLGDDDARIFYGTARILHAGDRSRQEPRELDAETEAAAARELRAAVSAVKDASFFDRTTGDTEVVALAEYDPASGRASELGAIGGGSLAAVDHVAVFTRRPGFWELGHGESGFPGSALAMAKVDVYAITGDRTVRLTGSRATAARAALLAKLALRDKALDSGSAMASARTREMLRSLEPSANGTDRALGELVIKDGLVERRMGARTVPVIEGALTAITADHQFAFARLATGRYVAVHFVP